MKVRIMAILIAGSLILLAGGRGQSQGNKGAIKMSDEDKIVGDWKVVSAMKRGQAARKEVTSKMTFAFDKSGVLHFSGGDKDSQLTYKLDPAKTPRQIDVTEPDKGLHKGIYAFDGDQLKICVAEPPLERPTKFASPDGENLAVMVLKRAPR